MATGRPYGEFYDFYSASPEYFGYTFIHERNLSRLEVFRNGILCYTSDDCESCVVV
jgi:hypothetical protein